MARAALSRLVLAAATLCSVALAGGTYLIGHRRGWILGLVLLAGCAAAYSLRSARRQRRVRLFLGNTAVGLCVGLLGFELAWPDEPGSDGPAVYGFREARGDPAAFRRWWERYLAEWNRTRREYLMPDPTGVHPYVPRPGSWTRFFDSTIRINALGFRGDEIRKDKGTAYRIFALGESTTFGATLAGTDRPWPEVLAQRLREELDCAVPIEVVNGGVPGWNLANNVMRWNDGIRPLKPDLVVSYHGINGFGYLLPALPSGLGAQVAPSRTRGSRWLGRAELSLRLAFHRWRFPAVRVGADEVSFDQLIASPYTELYLELARVTMETRVPLVLCTFNMAVREDTLEEVVRFYEQAFPNVRAQIVANQLHTRLLRALEGRPNIEVIDTSEGLDGAWDESFIDLVHLTQVGRDRLADHVLRGIRHHLERSPRARCRPVAAR